MTLSSLGWNDFFETHFQSFLSHTQANCHLIDDNLAGPVFAPARVTLEHKHAYILLSTQGELRAECTGRLLHQATSRTDFPAVGDWVVVAMRSGEARADIHAVLPRQTKFSRQSPGENSEQIVATNVDTVFLVTALDENYNLRRIERYLAVARASGAEPVILLNKADLHPDPAAVVAEVTASAPDVPILALSAIATRFDVSAEASNATVGKLLAPWLLPGRTVAVMGSSGVGKSTLINGIVGRDRQLTGHTSDAHGKGRHTTTHRELIPTPSGALVMDTPGMRELQLWDVEAENVDHTFSDISALAAQCRFGDCAHHTEPGCAIQAALDDGSLDVKRWRSFQKLQREQAYAARRSDSRLARENKAAWKKIHVAQRARSRFERED